METSPLLLLTLSALTLGAYAESVTIYEATLGEPDQAVPEISIQKLRQILADNSGTVFDARPYNEYALNHIPDVIHVACKPGTDSTRYTTDAKAIAAAVDENNAAPIVVLRCSDPFCRRSTRVAKDLLSIGYPQVRRDQLDNAGRNKASYTHGSVR